MAACAVRAGLSLSLESMQAQLVAEMAWAEMAWARGDGIYIGGCYVT
jgi:hypothetical protein